MHDDFHTGFMANLISHGIEHENYVEGNFIISLSRERDEDYELQ